MAMTAAARLASAMRNTERMWKAAEEGEGPRSARASERGLAPGGKRWEGGTAVGMEQHTGAYGVRLHGGGRRDGGGGRRKTRPCMQAPQAAS